MRPHCVFSKLDGTDRGIRNGLPGSGYTLTVTATLRVSDREVATWRLNKWIKKKIAIQVAFHAVTAFLSLLTGIVVLLITFFLAYAVIWFGFNLGISALSELLFNRRLHVPHEYILAACFLFLALLFIENARISREYLNSYATEPRCRTGILWAAGILGAIATLLANPSASAKMITDLLFSGPRLITSAVRRFQRVVHLIRMNLSTYSRVLMVLVQRVTRVSSSELADIVPGCDPLIIFSQLQELDGVCFVGGEPPGVVVADTLREELSHLFDVAEDLTFTKEPTESAVTAASEDSVCHQLLGLSPGASIDAIKAAYRKRIKECHPDKFGSYAPEFRRFAEERAKAINAAYETLMGKRTPQQPGI